MSGRPQGSYGGGFVERAVAAADRAEAALPADADAAAVAEALCSALFADVLGYGGDGYARDGRVVRLRDADGVVGATAATVGRGEDVGTAVVAAFEAASAAPSARYVVAGGLDRLLVFERTREDADDDEARTVAGVTATTHADIPLGEVIEAGRRGPLSQTLRPGRQLAVAKLADLRPGQLTPARPRGSGDDGQEGRSGDGKSGERPADDGGPGGRPVDDDPGALVGTLRDCLDDHLAPAVADAQSALAGDADAFDERADELREAVASARRGDGDGTAAGPARRRLRAHERAHADARDLRAAYGTWVRGAGRTGFTPSENRRAFARVAAFQLLEEVLLVRTLGSLGTVEDVLAGDAVERFEAFAEAAGVGRDAGDLLGVARERLADVFDRRAPDLAGWALSDDGVAEALSRTVRALGPLAFPGDAERAAAAYDRLLSVANLPGIDTDPADPDPLPGRLLDAAGYDADTAAGGADAGSGESGGRDVGAAAGTGADLLDPAVGDGRHLLAAADRLLAGLADAAPEERLRAVTDRLTGASPDPLACRVTETRLLLRLLGDCLAVRRTDDGRTLGPLPVHCTDPLIREHTPAALDREDYGYVVGAPPATLRRDVAEGPVADAYADYETAYYTYDTSALYVERASEWLAENGTLALRVAWRFRDTRFGTRLRERLPQWYRLEELREVPGTAAGGTPVLLVGRRFRRNEPVVDPEEYEPPTYGFTYAEGLDGAGVRRSSSRLTADPWDWDADGDDDDIGI
ncbi:hypothetical protein [Halobaculum sp. EA56]|uniref:hypothetical protein n=1 Tax=Halobaculum sp. EA56 TaxID=3421648 RepID=UPI003EBE6B1E